MTPDVMRGMFVFLVILTMVSVFSLGIVFVRGKLRRSPIFMREFFGFTLRRWLPSIVMLVLILTHAIASPTWWRVATGTKATSNADVTRDQMMRQPGYTTVVSDNISSSAMMVTRRDIQRAMDAERKGADRSAARGQLDFPWPTVFVKTSGRVVPNEPETGHVFQCDFRGQNCSIKLQSETSFVHIAKGPDFMSRLMIDRPTLLIEDRPSGPKLSAKKINEPEFYDDNMLYKRDAFSTDAVRVELSNGKVVDRLSLSIGALGLSGLAVGASPTLDAFAPIDVTYVLDFTDPKTGVLAKCLENVGYAQRAAPDTQVSDAHCYFDAATLEVFTLEGCVFAQGICPSYGTKPQDDLKANSFVPTDRPVRIQMGFDQNNADKMFEIAARTKTDAPQAGLIDLPNRAEIVRLILIDYLTVSGLNGSFPEMKRFLFANPDVDISDVAQVLGMVSPSIRKGAILPALSRQPQLWAWHGYAHHIQEELMVSAMRDLVQMGLANPF